MSKKGRSMNKSRLITLLFCCAISDIKTDPICIVINQPGFYTFGSIEADPTDPNDSIVCIQASDVVLDLSHGVFNQLSSNTMPGFNGVVVDSDLHNITIQNGTFNGLTGIAIKIGDGCSDIVVKDIEIFNSMTSGMVWAGSAINTINDGSITNCFISSCTGTGGNPAYGLRLIYCDNVTVQNCTFNNNDASTISSGFGASAEFCTTCKFLACDAHSNGGDSLAVGISLSNCQWTLVKGCNVLNTVARNAEGGKADGFLMDTCSFTSINNCFAIHNSNSVNEAYGFEAINGSDNTCVLCEARNNVGGTLAAGFGLNGTESGSSIFKCKSRQNDGGVAGVGYGILANGADHCDIYYNQLSNNKGLTGFGATDATTDSTNLYAGNVAFNNTTAGFDVPKTVGAFPVATAAVSDFSAITGTSKYINIEFTT